MTQRELFTQEHEQLNGNRLWTENFVNDNDDSKIT